MIDYHLLSILFIKDIFFKAGLCVFLKKNKHESQRKKLLRRKRGDL